MAEFSVSGVIERDTDLLLLEETCTNPTFSTWLLGVFLHDSSAQGQLTNAIRSVFSSLGESDLEFWYRVGDGRGLVVLVENKIGASFQKIQSSRYLQRAEEYLVRRKADLYRTALFAPKVFIASCEKVTGFDVRLSYEEVAEWIESSSDLGARGRYKVYLLRTACDKASSGYRLIEDRDVGAFWMSYWRLAISNVPELEMKQPSAKPGRSGFVYFHRPELPKGVVIVHKLAHGNLDLQFNGMGNCLSGLRRSLSAKLENDVQIAAAGKSGVVRILVPQLRPGMPFEPQQNLVLEGLLAASRLLKWYARFGHLVSVQ